jgi:hypothetical protein
MQRANLEDGMATPRPKETPSPRSDTGEAEGSQDQWREQRDTRRDVDPIALYREALSVEVRQVMKSEKDAAPQPDIRQA